MTRQNQHQGHYCHVCGLYRANGKLTGKGYARHICKDCARERKAGARQRRREKLEREQAAQENVPENDQSTE